jgi:hypothetical protein
MDRDEAARRLRFEGLGDCVPNTIQMIRSLSRSHCLDRRFLELELIPAMGLNDEALQEQPPELSGAYGKGLHIWQYPRQLAGYLAWLVDAAPGTNTYLEIGSRWGGMFLVVAEWLRHNGANLRTVIAVDPIAPTPFIKAYHSFLMQEKQDGGSPPELMYLQALSTSGLVNEVVERTKPDFVFVDGDHRLPGAWADHMMARKYARVVVHHDVRSQACPDTTFLWSMLKPLEAPMFEAIEFIDQYDSVPGNFLGIGVLRRRANYSVQMIQPNIQHRRAMRQPSDGQ